MSFIVAASPSWVLQARFPTETDTDTGNIGAYVKVRRSDLTTDPSDPASMIIGIRRRLPNPFVTFKNPETTLHTPCHRSRSLAVDFWR
ncbi:hypothetical protein [Amycolatopsis sp. GM8]|uniref:hypothetical protein n=1 Tax=Amycolatopsis sp. GM8 TaxID=2896530 RepID=UPI001F3FD22D|nr:hypothetical protein [Amycolatopsis sp. GM8]